VVSVVLAPASAVTAAQQGGGRQAPSLRIGSVGSFTPAVSDPRLVAALARRGQRSTSAFRFTPAAAAQERSRGVQVAVRARATRPQEAGRTIAEAPTSASPVTAVTPSSYNLGVSLGWRRFAITGDVAQADGGVLPGRRDSAQVDLSYRANRRLTGRVQVSAERAEGAQRIVRDDQAVALDVGGSYSIARNVDLTGGLRYRIARDRLEPLTEQRRESQAVYIGGALRF
jgi:hypothetical protein